METNLNGQPLTTQIFDFLLSIGGVKRIRGHSFFLRMMPADSIVLDLGANKGDFSRLLWQETGFFKCLCVEANPSLVADLKQNLESVPSCLIINTAISGNDSPHTVEFQISDNPEASSIDLNLARTFGLVNTVSIPTVTLDQLVHEYIYEPHPAINLVKIDVEGAEIDILQTAPESTLKSVEQITVEFHDFLDSEMLPSVNETQNLLTNKYGFVCINARYPQNDDVLFLNKNILLKKQGRIKFWAVVIYVKLIFLLKFLVMGFRHHV